MRRNVKDRPATTDVNERVALNDASMANHLMTTEYLKGRHDMTCGIHGAAKERKGAKKATSAARRRHEKTLIKKLAEE